MPATLNPEEQVNIPAQLVDTIKIVNHQVEDNIEQWIDIYYVFGTMVDGDFVQYFDPITAMGIPVQRVKLENGAHPLTPGSALKKCPTCEKWFQLETVCDVLSCNSIALENYDGFTRALTWGATDPDHYAPPICPYTVTKKALYEFLMLEVVPDPDNWPSERPLVALSSWE